MGRYYSGDIEGKFWFGIQTSDDASFFGGTILEEEYFEDDLEPSALNYFFERKDLEGLRRGLRICEETLGDYLDRLDSFFEENFSYNDQMLMDYLELDDKDRLEELLEWYARRILGLKIQNHVEEKNACSFIAEL